ncbi:ABC transporter ATP-binding protein [Alkalispirochaeta sphaeroplastigenens]|uniref:ABC transporter ATP-binding protein n=1 Tax=Alkalispirochaeta sphaeroplastigenens TaxID=1187066 RepID=A0A2S4JVP6_9SPIO|nr:ABC transporter ATP-binding protein [Alkalispirochaeta sphaeroplastigenens]POR03566.1 ABC transporter ATP-binding protein [Alkalispirochaeta sphaeroplastigenens]
MLKVTDLNISYGPIQAVKGISFELGKGEIVSILGANGAGKTSTLFGILGVVPAKGEVRYKGEPMERKTPKEPTEQGLILCPENRRIFPALTVEENLRMGTFVRGNFKQNVESVYGLFPRLKERCKQEAGSLSGGEQQMLAVGRALIAEPEVLMLDEPSLGLAPVIVDDMFRVLESLKERMSVLLVEQNATKALSISDRAYVLQNGVIVHSGQAAEMLKDDNLRKAYLGM